MIRERETNPPRPKWQMKLLGYFGITGRYFPRNSFWSSVWSEMRDNLRGWWIHTPWMQKRHKRLREQAAEELWEEVERERLRRSKAKLN